MAHNNSRATQEGKYGRDSADCSTPGANVGGSKGEGVEEASPWGGGFFFFSEGQSSEGKGTGTGPSNDSAAGGIGAAEDSPTDRTISGTHSEDP